MKHRLHRIPNNIDLIQAIKSTTLLLIVLVLCPSNNWHPFKPVGLSGHDGTGYVSIYCFVS
jgi:hypothetical protein